MEPYVFSCLSVGVLGVCYCVWLDIWCRITASLFLEIYGHVFWGGNKILSLYNFCQFSIYFPLTVCVFFDIFKYVDSPQVLQATTLPSRQVIILAC